MSAGIIPRAALRLDSVDDAALFEWLRALGAAAPLAESLIVAVALRVVLSAWRETLAASSRQLIEVFEQALAALEAAARGENPSAALQETHAALRARVDLAPPPHVGHLCAAFSHGLASHTPSVSEDARRRSRVDALTFAQVAPDGSHLYARQRAALGVRLGGLARMVARRGDWRQAVAVFDGALRVVEAPDRRSDLEHSAASILRAAGDLDEAERRARRCLAHELRCDRPARLGNHRLFLAQLCERRGALKEAASLVDAALDDYRQAYGDEHSEVARVERSRDALLARLRF